MLTALLESNAFLPSPLADDLIACHVPFDDLVGAAPVESGLEERARRGVATALVGRSGSGKSAVATWALNRVTTDFAPIRAPVFYETEATVREPAAFARYLLQRLLDEARAVEALTETERERFLQQASERLAFPTRTIGHMRSGSVDLPWLLKGEAAREVSTTLAAAELSGSTDSVLNAIDRAVDTLTAQGLTPIIVVDDTDRWLQVGAVDRRELVGRFFGTIVRMLAERGCGLVVAVHESYLELDEYTDGTRGFLTDTVRVPSLPDADALGQILEHRVAIQAEATSILEVLEAPALDRLFEYYTTAGKHSLRWTLQTMHTALSLAVGAGLEVVSAAVVDDAAAS